MNKKIIKTPQLGVNDKTAKLIEWLVSDKQKIEIGTFLCSIETTKTVIDVESEYEGYIKLLVSEGAEVEINQPICILYSSIEDYEENSEKDFNTYQETEKRSNLIITKKAQKYIDSYNIDIEKYFNNGIVKEKDVLKLIDEFKEESFDIKLTKEKNNILIYGASQGGYTALESLLLAKDKYEFIGFIDDEYQKQNRKYNNFPVFSPQQIEKFDKKEELNIFIAIANSVVRESKYLWARDLNINVISIIHPSTYISSSAKIGDGSFIKSGAIIDSNTIINEGCIIDNNTTVAHDNNIGKFCHLAPGVTLGSNINIGNYSIIGIGVSVSTNISIGKHNIISVGSSVTKNTESNSILEGVPAKEIGKTK